jgi:ABC-type sugar transport system ATPase subunit
MNNSTDPLIEIRDLKKRFGTVEALNGVNLELRHNEVLGLVGDNGAGKSTLIKTLVGLHQPTEGEILYNGDHMAVEGPKEAREVGIATVYQDLALVDELSVAENIFLGRLPTTNLAGIVPVVDTAYIESEAERILNDRLNIQISPETPVEYLSGGERQAVAIARALVTDPNMVFLDEPTSALSRAAANLVENLVAELKTNGRSVLLIDHNLEEIISMCDRIAIVFNGKIVDVVQPGAVDRRQIVTAMISGNPVDDPEQADPTGQESAVGD